MLFWRKHARTKKAGNTVGKARDSTLTLRFSIGYNVSLLGASSKTFPDNHAVNLFYLQGSAPTAQGDNRMSLGLGCLQ